MNTEIDHYPAISDNESEYSEYSEDSDVEEDEPDMDIEAPIIESLDGQDDGTDEDLTFDQLVAEVSVYLRSVLGPQATPACVMHTIAHSRLFRFWTIDWYNEMAHGYFLGPFDQWDDNDKYDAYVEAIYKSVNMFYARIGFPGIKWEEDVVRSLVDDFMDHTNVNTPRREVLWVVKNLFAKAPTIAPQK